MTSPGLPPGAPWLSLLILLLALPAGARTAAPPTMAAALRAPGPVLVVDCGEGRPHQVLADKVAGDLRALRGEAPERLWAGDLDRVHWEHANLVLVTTDAADPVVVGVAGSLGLRIEDDGLSLAGVTLEGDAAAAAVTLPHPTDDQRWVLLLAGTGEAALRRLDRHIRNDLTATAMVLDGHGERLLDLQLAGDGWRVPGGHPYRVDEVAARADGWRDAGGTRVAGWRAEVAVDSAAAELEVDCTVELEHEGRELPDELWLLLTPRAEIHTCEGHGVDGCVRFDARDGAIRVRVATRDGASSIHLGYRVALEERLEAWYLGPGGGYVMPEANWLPRVRGAPDEPYAERAPLALTLRQPDDQVLVPVPGEGGPRAGGVAPLLVWGDLREVDLGDGARAYLAPGAPDEVVARADALRSSLQVRAAPRSVPAVVVATDRPRAWLGEGVLLLPPDLLEPGPVDELDRMALARAATEELVRLQPPGGKPLRIEGRVEPSTTPVTVRLWRARGAWWEQLDEGPVAADGGFALEGVGKAPLMVSAEADGHLPRMAAVTPETPAVLALAPLDSVALICLRCGADLGAVRFPMVEVEPGRFEVEVALGELHRRYGTFPYAFELQPGQPDAVLVLDPARPLDQFPSFLEPDEFHADVVRFSLRTRDLRFWIEVPGGLLAPVEWIELPTEGEGT